MRILPHPWNPTLHTHLCACFPPCRCLSSESAWTCFFCAGLVELGSCVRPPLCCSSYCYTNLGLLLAWPVFITLPIYLLVTRLSWMNGWLLALLGWALLCVLLHIIVIGIRIRWRNCPKPQVTPLRWMNFGTRDVRAECLWRIHLPLCHTLCEYAHSQRDGLQSS